jgi:hypothetical protein
MSSSENSDVAWEEGEEGKWKEDDDDEEEDEWTEDEKENDDDEESGEESENDLEHAHKFFDMWSETIEKGDFGCAIILAISTLQSR